VLGGTEGQGFAQMMKGLETGRIQVASRALGVARAAFDGSSRSCHDSVNPCRAWAPVTEATKRFTSQ
jgi:alkylation response protein AidB-like acyl-CoA dehydrogenase